MLVGLVARGMPRHVVDEHLDELDRLVESAGGAVVGRVLQERAAPDPATLVGAGLLAGLSHRCADSGVEAVVFDEDLTGSQARNIERQLPRNVKVLDRSAVILDIFAQRARSAEAQTQVELAQLSYLLPRLTRRWRHLSRQAGGIGTRGVGETQLEIDRRLISRRISLLKTKLTAIERDRRLRRERRDGIPTLALVGYTNAGKSSLLCSMTGANELVEDRLFATLDPRARRAVLGHGMTTVMVDTVGFIRKLPHHLVAPFRSTLEVATDAALVLHVVDASHPSWSDHLRIGDEVLDGLGVDPERRLVVLNKSDLVPRPPSYLPAGVLVSALTGGGLDELRAVVRRCLLAGPGVAVLRVPLRFAEKVKRAVSLPCQLALRFSDEHLDLAVRVDGRLLEECGLSRFLVDGWEPVPS
jgi:GTP-binding protein HflX